LQLHVVHQSVCLPMCLSVTLVDQDHIGWKSWKTIAWTISQTLWAYSGTLRAPIYRVHRGVIFVIAQLSCFESSSITGGHSSGICGIYPEYIHYAGNKAMQYLTDLFCTIWETEIVPEEWHQGIIIPLYKGKGSRSECRNYRGITLLSVPGKVFSHVLLARIRPVLLAH